MKPEEIKIERGLTDVQNVLAHLKDVEKKEKKEKWLRENSGKLNRRKGSND